MDDFTNFFVEAMFSDKKVNTATVYINGQEFATYSVNTAKMVAKDLEGIAVDDQTGEVIAFFEK
jgi:hypothetical protein